MITQLDLLFVKSILPHHYEVQVIQDKNYFNCHSRVGIQDNGYEDDDAWAHIFSAIKQYFGDRFSEVFHNTCTWHVNFNIYLK